MEKKLLIVSIFIVLFSIYPTKVDALSSNREYYLNRYDINIIVNENNTLNITEKIGAYFNVNKHGIFRKIPLRNEIKRLDGTTSKNRAKISEIKVNDNYTLSTEIGYKVIKIGDASYTLTGPKNYEISYLYNLGKDTGKGYDELYFNLIGDEWDTSISNITFTITMPKEFDSSKLGFSSGYVGSIDSSKIIYNVNGNTIKGRYDGTLSSKEALTVRLELPEGYFVGASNNVDSMMLMSIILPVVFVVVAYLIWRIYGKDEHVIETVEFYPPEGFNSLEVGFLYNGKADNRDVTSLLIYLANKGYLKISKLEEETSYSAYQNFKITKLKEYDGNNENERLFLEGLSIQEDIKLFKTSHYIDKNITEVTSKDLYNKFYIVVNDILSNINKKENIQNILEKNANNKKIFIILMIIATYLLITIPPIYIYNNSNFTYVLFAILLLIGFTSGSYELLDKVQTIYEKKDLLKSSDNKATQLKELFSTVLALACFGVAWIAFVFPMLINEYIYLIIYILGLLCVFCLITCLKYLPKRTPYGNKMLGKLKGFKRFLEIVEKEKLEAMVMENPTYFYDILPYTYVLGVSDKWIKKFESISLQAPNWYDGYSSFDTTSFGNFMNSTMKTASSVMSSSSSSSSGGSSGGGSSGGGSGGGGGGSW